MAASHSDTLLGYIHRLADQHAASELSDGELLQRFGARRDQVAFTILMRRHSRLVWSVCRNILPNENDAEDAFQATFLVLSTRARSIRKTEVIAGWLHGVAHRIAIRAKQMTAKRQGREKQAAERERATTSAGTEAALRELQAILDAEVTRLPQKYRDPFVLCCLEGRRWKDAAAELGWTEGTLSTRIAQARKLLQARLARRGVTLSAALTAAELWRNSVSASVPPTLSRTTLAVAAGRIAESIPRKVAVLAASALRTAKYGKLLAQMTLIVTIGLAAAGYHHGAVGVQAPEEADPPRQPRAERRTPAAIPNREPLPREAIARLGTTRFRHAEARSVAFTPDGKTLISLGNSICIWDAATGKRISRFDKKLDWTPSKVAISPDGKLLAAAEYNKSSITLWELGTGQLLRSIGNNRSISVRFSPNSKLLLSLGNDPSLAIWDVATGERLHGWQKHESPAWAALFTPDNKTLISTDGDGVIRFRDVASGKVNRELTGGPQHTWRMEQSVDCRYLAILGTVQRPAGPQMVMSTPENLVRIWDVTAGKEIQRIEIPSKDEPIGGIPWGLNTVLFAPDGLLVTSGPDAVLRFWEPASARLAKSLPLKGSAASDLAFSPDGKTLALANDSAIHLIDADTGKDRFPDEAHHGNVYRAAVTQDGRTIVTASGNELFSWDALSGQFRRRWEGHGQYINGSQLIDGKQKLITSSYQDDSLRVWDLITHKETGKIDLPGKWFILHAVAPDGKTVAVGDNGGKVILFDCHTGKQLVTLEHPEGDAVYGAAFSPDGSRITVCYSADNAIRIWNLATRKTVKEYTFEDKDPPRPRAGRSDRSVYYNAVSPDRRLIALGSQHGFLEIRDLVLGTLLRRVENLADGVCPMAFSIDGRTLAWSGWKDYSVHLIEVATGRERHCFVGHTGRVLPLAFSADGKFLVSGGGDTTGLVWDLTGRLHLGEQFGKSLSTEDLAAGWNDLVSDDAARAFRAIQRLSGSPNDAMPFLAARLKPAAPVDKQRIDKLIAELDSDRFAVRDNAFKELEKLGDIALELCRTALEARPTLEARRRLEMLLEKHLEGTWSPSPERLRALRAVEVLEMAGTTDARQVLQKLANAASTDAVTREAKAALDRLDARMKVR